MLIRENVPVAPLTALEVGGPARYFAEVKAEAEVMEAVEFARSRIPRLAHAMRAKPDHGEMLALACLNDVVDAFVDVRDAAFGIVGAEQDEHSRTGRRLRDLFQRFRSADVDAAAGEALEARRGCKALADTVA